MTKAKALREYFKKYHNIDVAGMSQVAVLKNFFREKYGIEAIGSSPASVIDFMAQYGGGGDTSDVVGEGKVDFMVLQS